MNRHDLDWRASPHAVRLAAVALVALAVALVTLEGAALIVAVPPLVMLAAARPPTVSTLDAEWRLSTERCFEGETVELHLVVRAVDRLDQFALTFVPGSVKLLSRATVTVTEGSWAEATWTLAVDRWGRRPVGTIEITCLDAGRTRRARLSFPAGELGVFPVPKPSRAGVRPADLLARLGDHTSRVAAEGVEFTGIRPYVPGDRPRRVNWAVSSRRGELHVNQQSAERAADVVVLLDTLSEAGDPGDTTLDWAVRGAAAVIWAQLRRADRVGIVVLGDRIRWLRPDLGERHFYRIAEAVLDAWREPGYRRPHVTRIPPPALPPGALVLVFSPLLDHDAVEVIRSLRERGFETVVVDVLREEPPRPADDLALRLWRLERAGLVRRMTDLGIPVVPWTGPDTLRTGVRP
ncbi:DUF58 domain-containing protein [Actinomadura sp. NEAU-AAG7]|uniref:DUF58 domain-containing protein n=1 Tax=Actinomadura sp. NEAU-AAG7 TaxID=2839640 RepID=UPI001BE48BD9|nr:DUF58 domain-containing protein [Actinomadura sp. NEAU-AAG7]MBT2210178.1 DUF58 domain-containing protein [Actinomadura sp. NEAU-AAG7]